MRVAIISDIHGNLVALKAAVSDIETRKVSQIVCLGDVVAAGPQPTEVIEFLPRLACLCVMGNTDETLVGNFSREFWGKIGGTMPEEERRNLEALDLWTRKRLTTAHRRYLSTFKPMIKTNLGASESLLCFHGSPVSNNDMILSATSDEKLTGMFEGRKERIFAGGHTHIQMLRPFLSSIIVNPGSIGLAFRRGLSGRRVYHCTMAEYALINSSGGTLSVEFVSVPYSLPDLRRAVRKSGMPDPDW
jgi:predicted phosphodiesterase